MRNGSVFFLFLDVVDKKASGSDCHWQPSGDQEAYTQDDANAKNLRLR